jgi:hypothetical protein
LKPWHVVHEPSHPPRGSSAGAHTLRRRVVCSLLCSWPWLRLNARFYQAEPAPVVGTTKCPESLCLMLVLPSSESRVPTLPRTLLPVPRSYGLIRQSHVALLSFGNWPRLRSLCRLLPAPAATGIFPTLFLRICPVMPEPIPRRVPLSAFAWFFLSVIGLPQEMIWIGFPLRSANAIFRGQGFGAAAISLCSGLTVCSPPRSLPPLRVTAQGGRGFYVRAERASLPSHVSDMLSARQQAIGGTRTFTSQDLQFCRLLTFHPCLPFC